MSNINTSSEIALTKIKTLITQNKLLKGNKLPNERLLSDITNTKRAHVRNALLILEKVLYISFESFIHPNNDPL